MEQVAANVGIGTERRRRKVFSKGAVQTGELDDVGD